MSPNVCTKECGVSSGTFCRVVNEVCDQNKTCKCGNNPSCQDNPSGRLCDGVKGKCKCDKDVPESCPNPIKEVCQNEICGEYYCLLEIPSICNIIVHLEVYFRHGIRPHNAMQMFLVLKEPKTCKASSDCEGEETCDLTLTECQCGKRDSCYGNPDGRICDAINNICKCDPKDKKSCPPGQVCRKEKCGRYL